MSANILINFVTNNLKTVVNNLKRDFEKYHHEWYFNKRH